MLLARTPDRARGPLAPQVEAGLRDAIRSGRLGPGARVPPSRTLARDLGVSRRLVVGAYEQLVAEGWLQARVGAGTFVSRALPAGATAADRAPATPVTTYAAVDALRPPVRYDFFPGHPDLSAFPRVAWGRAVRDALRELPDAAFGYGDGRGLPELREELAALVARSRGVVCRPEQIVVCQGAVQALGLLVRALRGEAGGGRPRIAVEDPYLPEHRAVLDAAGAEIVPVPVDALGVRDEAVAHADVVAALLTPAHQCPTGVTLAAGRRTGLARWAQETGGLLIEDDYDAEYRYDRAPVAALQALAPGQVAYVGSVSKTLAPGLRLAWIVVPEDRLGAVVRAKRLADGGSPVLEQAALARFLRSGGYDRHVRAMRRAQRGRRDALVAAVAEDLPEAEVDGIAAGLHAVLRLPGAVDARALVCAAAVREVRCYPLSAYRVDPPAQTTAIVMGYGALAPAAIREGVRRLADALASIRVA